MSLTIKTFSRRTGDLEPQQLVERRTGTELAFFQTNFGNGVAYTLADEGVPAGQTIDRTVTVPEQPAAHILQVYTTAQGELSIFDGSGWVGPFPVAGAVQYGMLLRWTPAPTSIRIRWKAIQPGRVTVQVDEAISPEHFAAGF